MRKSLILDIALIMGSVLFISGVSLSINDSMTASWCPSSNRKLSFDPRDYLNGPLIMILGFLLAIYPAIVQIKKWKQQG